VRRSITGDRAVHSSIGISNRSKDPPSRSAICRKRGPRAGGSAPAVGPNVALGRPTGGPPTGQGRPVVIVARFGWAAGADRNVEFLIRYPAELLPVGRLLLGNTEFFEGRRFAISIA
jgi:hypothetical protein